MMVDMKGFVEYEDKQYPFSFSDSTLNLYPDKFDSKSIEEWLSLIHILCPMKIKMRWELCVKNLK